MGRVITIDARMLGFSGIGTYLQNLLENYTRMECDFSFRLACPRQESVREFESNRFTWVRADAPIYGLREQWQIPRVSKGSDLLHCPHYNVPCFYRGRLLVTIHDLTFFTNPEWHERSKVPFFRRAITYAASHADVLISVSDFTSRKLDEIVPRHAPLVTAPLGVDLDRFSLDARHDEDVLRAHHLPVDRQR